MKTDNSLGCDELLLSSKEYVGECRVTLFRPLSAIELSMSLDVVSGSLYTEFVLISWVGHDASTDVYGLIILAGVPETYELRKKINIKMHQQSTVFSQFFEQKS